MDLAGGTMVLAGGVGDICLMFGFVLVIPLVICTFSRELSMFVFAVLSSGKNIKKLVKIIMILRIINFPSLPFATYKYKQLSNFAYNYTIPRCPIRHLIAAIVKGTIGI